MQKTVKCYVKMTIEEKAENRYLPRISLRCIQAIDYKGQPQGLPSLLNRLLQLRQNRRIF